MLHKENEKCAKMEKHLYSDPKAATRCNKLQKVANIYQKLQETAKCYQKLPKIAIYV